MMTMRRDRCAYLTEDSHINDRGSAAAVDCPHDATAPDRRRLQPLVSAQGAIAEH